MSPTTSPETADSTTRSGESTARVVPVTVFSDYTCPWCYIGSRRLDRLRDGISGELELKVEWKPFEIHSEVPREGMPVEELGYPEERWKAMMARLREQASEEGLEMVDRATVSNTHEALLASVYAQEEEPERFPSFHEAIFQVYFGEGRDLGRRDVILEVAGECGLDVEVLEEALEKDRYEPVLEETTREARRKGISGTPTFVFGQRYGAVGAQPVPYLRRVLERALEEEF